MNHKNEFKDDISKINSLGDMVVKEQNQDNFNEIVKEHEEIISTIICKKPIQKTLFKDYRDKTMVFGLLMRWFWNGYFCH